MPWLKNGDNAATYPRLMAVRADRRSDERTVNEVAGWLWRCFTQSAGHMTDYVCDIGTAEMLGGSRTKELVRLSKKTGLLSEAVIDGVPSFRLIEDPEFIHMRLKEEVLWERQQRNDTRDPRLRVPVLLRDGDNCRWCGVLVQWMGKTSPRTGTLDHLVPGQPGTVATMIVSCKGCNTARGGNVDTWDADHTMRPAPRVPRYGPKTAKFLSDNGYPTDANVSSSSAGQTEPTSSSSSADPTEPTSSSSSADPTSSEHARSGTSSSSAERETPDTSSSSAERETSASSSSSATSSSSSSADPTSSEHARSGTSSSSAERGSSEHAPPEVGPKSNPRSDGTSSPGSGRVGSGEGWEGSGRAGRGRGRRGRGGQGKVT